MGKDSDNGCRATEIVKRISIFPFIILIKFYRVTLFKNHKYFVI